jgi:hypothetical protein
MHSRKRRRVKLDQELKEPSAAKSLLGGQIEAGSLLRDLYYKSDSSAKERGSADEMTIRDTSDSLLNLPIPIEFPHPHLRQAAIRR